MRESSLLPAAWPPTSYTLLDFGGGRKLEQFGSVRLDRPCPAARAIQPSAPHLWDSAAIRVDRAGKPSREPPQHWEIRVAPQVRFRLRVTPFGHVGVFPEQISNWNWITQYLRRCGGAEKRVLNLFAYTGGATMAALLGGASQVVHVDASEPAVKWARANARLSGWQDAPVRWIVDDARKFVRREYRRGRTYDLVIMDPPTWGHGSRGQRWEIARDLESLLVDCSALVRSSSSAAMLVSAHCTAPHPSQIATWLAAAMDQPATAQRLQLPCADGRQLDAGFAVRCVAPEVASR
ncbi:MAG: SAM-dependent methyltransferase [Planctomycetota bacterium]|nr:MAG: SAM-dependent methyltransferase [Planctomycetota bacterium]